ncbi:nucleolar complex protein-like protein [Calycina marina]|uniref:Nucleolar complex protein-like protein n=1 Tax=Calycina marina TaxID=1763456 RepID=A0A9P7Z6F9_9HELO|nr:nucleolar complex protein-like protein [Calycina marina]
MSAATASKGLSIKRKRTASKEKSIKRARSESVEEEDLQAQILDLEEEVLKSKKNYNNIAKLIQILQGDTEDGDVLVVAAISLCRVFTRLMVSGEMAKSPKALEKEVILVRWLRERYMEYKSALLVLLGEEGVESNALTLCMRLLKTEGEHLYGVNYNFPTTFLTDILHVLLTTENDGSTRQEFSQKFVEEYDDIRFYTFDVIEKLIKGPKPSSNVDMFDTAIEILRAIESVPEDKEELEDFYIKAPVKKSHGLYSLAQHKKRAQGAWLALTNREISKEQRKVVLGLMRDSIAPWFTKPELLMDFLADSYDSGGSTSLLALSGVYFLIQEKNLDYPSFFKKLYSLLDRDILSSKHRSRFLRLLDTFLGSTHLPAALVASFLKRLSRLTLNAPPSGIVPIIPWIYNMLKKHPSCTFMVHRVPRNVTARELLESQGMSDPFSMEEEDPMETNAIESCLWEIVTLQSHFHPNVASLAKIISEQFTKHAYNLEDFLDHNSTTMLASHLSKTLKREPDVEFEIPKKIFLKHNIESGLKDGLVGSLWEM